MFELSLKRGNYGGILIYRELLILVLLGVWIFNTIELSSLKTFFLNKSTVDEAGVFVISTAIILIISIAIFSRIPPIKKYTLSTGEADQQHSLEELKKTLFVSSLVLIILIAFLHQFGVNHAFATSLIFGHDLMHVRLANRYSTNIPTVLISYQNFITVFCSALLGALWKKTSKTEKITYSALIIYSSSLFGAKAPIVTAIMIATLSYASFQRNIRLGKALWKSLYYLPLIFLLVFALVKIQYTEIDAAGFQSFLIDRIGAGQIQGFYEQYAIMLKNPNYIWNSVPFANFFIDYEYYNKDLMMLTWGAHLEDQSQTGVMNSWFAGEALAIGGFHLAIASPIIVAFNYCTLFAVTCKSLILYFRIDTSSAKKITSILIPTIAAFTGDIAGLLIFKLSIMTFIFISSIFFATYIYSIASRKFPKGNSANPKASPPTRAS